jgi:hypothetical protein
MIALVSSLSTKHPVRIACVDQDDRDEEAGTDQHEEDAGFWGCCLVMVVSGHNVGEDADISPATPSANKPSDKRKGSLS